MNIKYYYKNIDPLEKDVTNYIEEKINSVEKLLEISEVKVEVSNRKENNKVFMKVSLFSEKDADFQAENHGVTFNQCIDIIEEELKKQIRRFKEKNRDLKEKGGRSIKDKMSIAENARL